MAYRTETHRLQLKPAEHDLLDRIERMTQRFYNAANEDRRNAWEHGKRLASARGLASPYLLDKDVWAPPSKQAQFAFLTQVRADDPDGWGALPTNIGREVLERIDRAYQGVFRNGRGLPRFKSQSRWRSFGWNEMNGVRIVSDRIVFEAFGKQWRIAFKRHRAWPEDAVPKTVRFVRKCSRWEVHIQIAYAVAGELVLVKPIMPAKAELIGLTPKQMKTLRKERREAANAVNKQRTEEWEAARHAGFRAALIDGSARAWDANVENHATNDLGERIENPRLSDRHRQWRSAVEVRLARQQAGSKRFRKTVARRRRLGERERNANRTFAHQASAGMVRQSPFLVFEALRLGNMTASAKGTVEEPGKNVAQKSGLNREILGNCHGMRMTYAAYKAERAGGLVVRVPPQWTSQDCSDCGDRGENGDDRVFRCRACALAMDRDWNAALNIRNKAWGVVAPSVERLPSCKARKDQDALLAA